MPLANINNPDIELAVVGIGADENGVQTLWLIVKTKAGLRPLMTNQRNMEVADPRWQAVWVAARDYADRHVPRIGSIHVEPAA